MYRIKNCSIARNQPEDHPVRMWRAHTDKVRKATNSKTKNAPLFTEKHRKILRSAQSLFGPDWSRICKNMLPIYGEKRIRSEWIDMSGIKPKNVCILLCIM